MQRFLAIAQLYDHGLCAETFCQLHAVVGFVQTPLFCRSRNIRHHFALCISLHVLAINAYQLLSTVHALLHKVRTIHLVDIHFSVYPTCGKRHVFYILRIVAIHIGVSIVKRCCHALQQAHCFAIDRRCLYLWNHGYIQAVPIHCHTIHKHKVLLHTAPQMAQAQ